MLQLQNRRFLKLVRTFAMSPPKIAEAVPLGGTLPTSLSSRKYFKIIINFFKLGFLFLF
jgi:hypothetical protein